MAVISTSRGAASGPPVSLIDGRWCCTTQALFFNHLYDPISMVRDNEVKAAMSACGVTCHTFNSDVLYEPWELLSPSGQPLVNFNDYWKRCDAFPPPPLLLFFFSDFTLIMSSGSLNLSCCHHGHPRHAGWLRVHMKFRVVGWAAATHTPLLELCCFGETTHVRERIARQQHSKT